MNFRRSVTIAELAAWSRKTLKKNHFIEFLNFKILFQKDLSRHQSTCFVQISWNLVNGKPYVIYLTRQICLALQLLLLCRSHPKSARPDQTIWSECSSFHQNRFTFGRVISERVNTFKAGSKVNPIFGWSWASSRIITLWRYKDLWM